LRDPAADRVPDHGHVVEGEVVEEAGVELGDLLGRMLGPDMPTG